MRTRNHSPFSKLTKAISHYANTILLLCMGLPLIFQSYQCRPTIETAASATAASSQKLRNDQGKTSPGSLQKEVVYFMNDPTLRLSPYVERPWLRLNSDMFPDGEESSGSGSGSGVQKPKVKLVLTDYGWNHPDETKGLDSSRYIRTRELLQGFVDHPYFDPTFRWSDMVNGKTPVDPAIQYIVFLDLETGFDSNYPDYQSKTQLGNMDLQHGRSRKSHREEPCSEYARCASFFKRVLASPLFQQVKTAQLLFIGFGYPEEIRQSQEKSSQLSLLSVSVEPKQLLADSDMGFPPPCIHPLVLNYKERRAIETCESELSDNRPFFVSFIGDERRGYSARAELFSLNNGEDILLMSTENFNQAFQGKQTYDSVMKGSQFAVTPRGHSLFSYRFPEALSAGAIPVVQADGWVLPFRKELIDWSECAVIIPEADTAKTVEVLRKISSAQRCKMRQRCYEIYQKYMANPENTMAGVVDSIVAMNAAKLTQ